MAKLNQKLGDAMLLSHIIGHRQDLLFISDGTWQQLATLEERAKAKTKEKGANDVFMAEAESIRKLWEGLLVDAIHALKARDGREKVQSSAYRGTYQVDDEDAKSKARLQNAFGLTELRSYFQDFTEFESVLYGSDRTYRDHVAHVVRVWLTGIYLVAPSAGQGWDAMALAVDPGLNGLGPSAFSREERWAMWTIVALCHDLGYPLEKTHRVNAVADKMLSHFGTITTGRYQYALQTQNQALYDITLRLVSSRLADAGKAVVCPDDGDVPRPAPDDATYATHVQAKYLTKFAQSFEHFRHGIVSCLVLMKTLVFFMETDYDLRGEGGLSKEDARQFHIRREILRAIASHTCTEIYHLSINSLGFLLILCDELQEWGRPTFGNVLSGTWHDLGVDVKVTACDLAQGNFAAEVQYTKRGPTAKEVRNAFRRFHKLMRAALGDEQRTGLDFGWSVKLPGQSVAHVYHYSGSATPFDEMTYKDADREGALADLYSYQD